MASKNDIQLASLAAGFTLGFGFLTCWKAIKQTRQNRNPLRSVYIYMVWGEIAANLAIGIIGWLFLDGVLGPTVPVLFFILFLWVFEIQLLMQIIINRISVVAERRSTIQRLKWGTAAIITAINIAVFCIWIPAHTVPPVSKTYVLINEYWDRTSKVLILLVDAGLNWYFLRTVKARLVDHHGLTKYAPLVSFNAKLMVVSIGMDAMLIGLMSLPNQVVYIQFHPVTYMVKLNIEMSMASLITRLARGEPNNDQNIDFSSLSYSNGRNQRRHQESNGAHHGEVTLQSFRRATIVASPSDEAVDTNIGRTGIHRRMEVEIKSEYCAPSLTNKPGFDSDRDRSLDRVEDEQSLTRNAGHPTGAQKKDLSDSDETSRWEYAGSRDS